MPLLPWATAETGILPQLERLAADEDEVIAESAAWAIRKTEFGRLAFRFPSPLDPHLTFLSHTGISLVFCEIHGIGPECVLVV